MFPLSPFQNVLRDPFELFEPTQIQRAIAVLRKFGTDAHIWLPGVGSINGLQAANYLLSDASTGLAPVDQYVGLASDALGGLGVDLVTNGGFDTGAAWGVTGAGVSIASGQLTLTATGGFTGVTQTLPGDVLAQKTVLLEYTVVSNSLNVSTLHIGGAVGRLLAFNGPTLDANIGRRQAMFACTGTGNQFVFQISLASTSGCIIIDNISVREVTGIHATQPTTANKPKLVRGAVNQLLWSNDFTQSVWNKGDMSFSGPQITTSATTHNLSEAYAVAASTAYTFAFTSKRGTMENQKYSVKNVTGGTDIISATSYYSQLNDLTETLVVVNFTTPAGCVSANVYPLRDSSSAGTCYISNTALFQGTYTAAQIQALGGIPLTTTAPASTALGSFAWQFYGSNDSLALSSVPFQMSDDHLVVAAVNCTTVNSTGRIFSIASTASNTSRVCDVYINSSGYAVANWVDDAGVVSNILGATDLRGKTVVISARKVGNNKVLRVNGVQIGSTNTTALGTTTVTVGAIGQLPTLSPTGFFVGSMHHVSPLKGTFTDAETLLAEKLAANAAGITI